MKESVPNRMAKTQVRTNLEFRSGYSAVKELIPEVEDQSDSGRHTADSNSPLRSGIDGENDVGGETEHSRV